MLSIKMMTTILMMKNNYDGYRCDKLEMGEQGEEGEEGVDARREAG